MKKSTMFSIAGALVAIAITSYALVITGISDLFPSLTDTEVMWTNASLLLTPLGLANIFGFVVVGVLAYRNRHGQPLFSQPHSA